MPPTERWPLRLIRPIAPAFFNELFIVSSLGEVKRNVHERAELRFHGAFEHFGIVEEIIDHGRLLFVDFLHPGNAAIVLKQVEHEFGDVNAIAMGAYCYSDFSSAWIL